MRGRMARCRHHTGDFTGRKVRCCPVKIAPLSCQRAVKKERKKTDNLREGWEDGTPPPHRDFKERGVMR